MIPIADQMLRAARILIVDDNETNVELIRALLEEDGYDNLESTTSSLDGLALYLGAPDSFDLILLDLRMPDLDGLGFIAAIREARPDIAHPVIILSAQADQRSREQALSAGVRDYLTKPVVVWEVLHRVRNALSLQLLWRQTEALNRDLEERVMRRTVELEETRREVIRRLATAGEFRDNDTGQHVERMSQYAYVLARGAGMADQDARALRDAAPLHDIGKIAMPDAILLKEGPLTDDEWVTMRRHAEIGGAILDGSGFALLELAREIAVSHHERWDGSGYPLGLAGQDIPLSGRIVAVADVFDALTSQRPYKRAWSIEEALGFLKDNAGKLFDPGLVAQFEASLPEMLAIRNRLADR